MGEIITLEKKAASMRTFLQKPETQAQFAAALPSVGLTPQRFVRAALTAFTLNPQLYDCTPESVMRTLILSAQYGIPPTGKFGMYLIPFKNGGKVECTPIIDYRALLQMARRSGDVTRVAACVVHEGDEFEWEEGSKPFLRHKVKPGTEDAPVLYAYAIAHLKSAPDLPPFVVLTRGQVEKYRGRSKARNSPMWTNDWEAAACKTAIRRLCESGRLPMQDGDQRLVELMQAEDVGIDLPAVDRLPPEMLRTDATVSDVPPTVDDFDAEESRRLDAEAARNS